VFKVTPSHDYTEIGTGTQLAAGGHYEIALQPGTYRLWFDAAPGMYRTEYWNNARSVDTAHDVVVTGTTPVTASSLATSRTGSTRYTRPCSTR
jgi:hypothetical protein